MAQLRVLKILFLLAMATTAKVALPQSGNFKIDHRYSPEWWQSLICLPDDPVKTLVGKEGQVFGDYGYEGGPRLFSFSLQFDSRTPSVWKSQELPSAKVPMTYTRKESDGVDILEQTFLQIPGEQALNTIQRSDSRRVVRGWSKPSVPCDSAFYDIASGLKGLSGEGLVEFQVKVAPGSSFNTALGFCEGELDTAGKRTMRIYVEGAAYKDIDVVKDFGPKTPGIYFVKGKDVNHDGIFNIIITNKPGALIRDAFVNGIWLFKDREPSAASVIAGKENRNAVLYARAANIRMPERRYHLYVTLKNTTAVNKTFSPALRYLGIDEVRKESGRIRIGDHTSLNASEELISVDKDSSTGYTFLLKPLLLKAGETKNLTVTVSRFYPPAEKDAALVPTSKAELNRSLAWWKKNSPAATAISVPDSGIQSIVESSLRNIFQARELRKGNKSFHVGPTQYRGLWIADGSFLLETATMLNYVKDVRSCIDYLTNYQLPDGGFEMIPTFHKENGLVLFMLTRHAMLTQDKKWMEDNWKVIQGCIRRINYLRGLAMEDSSKPYYTLLPDGNVDGGIQHGNDYSNTEWCLGGMKWAIWAANWLGKKNEAATWQKEYDDFYAKFMKMAEKDLRKDEFGNTYLPVLIGNEQNQAPQKGQWAFCQSVYPGRIFDDNDTALEIAKNTVEMLHDHREEGLVINTGWMEQGLWTYFASFYGHALQWLGRGKEIPELLYAFGNHSSPTMVWREEQKPQGKGNEEVGDMPHNWASAEFIRMVVHMIQLDHGRDLHLFEGLPLQWTKAGAVTKLNGIRTPFGRIDLSFTVNTAGDAGSLKLKFLDEGNLPEHIVIHKESWNPSSKTETVKAAANIERTISFK